MLITFCAVKVPLLSATAGLKKTLVVKHKTAASASEQAPVTIRQEFCPQTKSKKVNFKKTKQNKTPFLVVTPF